MRFSFLFMTCVFIIPISLKAEPIERRATNCYQAQSADRQQNGDINRLCEQYEIYKSKNIRSVFRELLTNLMDECSPNQDIATFKGRDALVLSASKRTL